MYVKDWMTSEPTCISKDSNVSAALDLMSDNNFHRIPVVDGKKLVGLITEGVIAENSPSKATSLSMFELNYLLSKNRVDSIMIRDVITIDPDALLEEAAAVMRKHDIGCLVVVKGQEVKGIITQNDIFSAFIDLMGYYHDGSRYVVRIQEDKTGVLADLTNCFFNKGASIANLAVYRKDKIDVVIRASGVGQEEMNKTLVEKGYEVISVMASKIEK